MKKIPKIIMLALTIIGVIAMLVVNCSAAMFGDGDRIEFGSYYVPDLIMYGEGPDFFYAYSNRFSGTQDADFTINDMNGEYLDIIVSSDLDDQVAFVDPNYSIYKGNNVNLYYPMAYHSATQGPSRDPTLTYRFSGMGQNVLTTDVYLTYYRYAANGELISNNSHKTYTFYQDPNEIYVQADIYLDDLLSDFQGGYWFEIQVNHSTTEFIEWFSFEEKLAEEYSLVVDNILPTNLNVTVQEINPNILEWLITSFDAFMNVEIFGNGITLGGVIGVAIAVPLVIYFLKALAGG